MHPKTFRAHRAQPFGLAFIAGQTARDHRVPEAREAPADGRAVITSYSIHYTKLYDTSMFSALSGRNEGMTRVAIFPMGAVP